MKKKVFSRLIVSLLLLMLITALSATLITASEEDIEMEDMMSAILSDEELSGYKQGDTVSLSNDGYIGIPVELTTYYDSSKPTKSGYDVDATNLVIYVVNAHFERVGTDTDVEIIKSMLERGYIVTVADYRNNGRAISPDLDFSLQAVRNTVLTGKYFTDTTVFASGSYYNSFVVPSGYDVSLHRVFWEIDKHSTDGTLEKIVEYWNNDFRAWTKNKDIVIPWVDENGNRKQTQTAHDGTAPVWLNADGSENPDGTYIKIKHTRAVDITDCVKRDGSPIDLNLYMHLIYPTGAAEVPVLALVGSAEHIAKGTTSADRPQFIGATLRGYAAVTFDHGWTPMARNDHYGYFDGSTPDMGSVTGNNTTYSIQFYNEVEIATAAMRYIRYLSLSTDEFNFKLDAIGAYGNSKGGWMQFLGAVDPYTASGERKIYIGHHGETRYENGKTETVGIIDGGEEQPWLTYDGDEIDGGADFVYCSCGGTSESILPGHAPMFISCQLNDGSCWGSSREFIMAARKADVPAMWVEVNLGHTFASGPDTKFGIDDTYSAFFNFLGYWLKGDRVRVEYIYADMTYGGMPTYAPFTVKFTGPVGESEIGKITLSADDGIAVSGRWESAFGNTEWTFYPDCLRSNTEYKMTVPAGIKAANGGTSENASSYSVTTGYESADVLTRVTGSRGTYISFTVPDKSGITEFDVNKYLLRIKASGNSANKLGIYSVSGFDQSSPDSSTVGEELSEVYVNGEGYYEVDISEFITSCDVGATVTLLIKEERAVGNPTVFSWDVSTARPGTLLVSNTVESQVVELDGNAVLEIGKTKPTETYPLDPFYNNLSYNTIINCTALVRSGNMTVDDSGRRLNISFRVLDTTSRTLQIYVLDASNRAKGIIDRDGTVFNVRTKAGEWVDVSFALDIYDPLKYGADGLFNKKVYIKTYGFGEEVYPIYFDDFRSVEEITAVDIEEVSLVSTTTEQRENPLKTEYGTIPEQYASVEDYPFAVFNSNGDFVLATDIWATDSGTGALGAGQKQSYVNLIILLRRDYHFTDATVYNNFAFYYGDLKFDLGDNKLYLEQTHSEGLFFCHAKRSHRTDVVIENGEIVFGGGELITIGSRDISGYTYQSEVKQFNFTFDAVTFSHSEGSLATSALFTNASSGSPVPVISNLLFNECVFDFEENLPAGFAMLTLGEAKGNLTVNATVKGGELRGGDLSSLSFCTLVGESSALRFEKGAMGSYLIQKIRNGGKPASIQVDIDGLGYSYAESGTDGEYTLYSVAKDPCETPYGRIPNEYSNVEAYPFAIFQKTDTGYTFSAVTADAFADNEPAVTAHLSGSVIVYMRRDFTLAGHFNNLGRYADITYDLGGNRLYNGGYILVINTISAYDVGATLKNGEIVNSSATTPIIRFGKSKATNCKKSSLLLEGLTLTNSGAGASYLFAYHNFNDTVDLDITLRNCVFDMGEGTGAQTLFPVGKTNAQTHTLVEGGEIRARSMSALTIAAVNESGSSILFNKYEGEYTSLLLPSGSIPTDLYLNTGSGERLKFGFEEKTANGDLYKLFDPVTPYGEIGAGFASVTDYPFVVFKGDGSFVGGYPVLFGNTGGDLSIIAMHAAREAGDGAVILMRRDYIYTDDISYPNIGNNAGERVLDLGGYTIYDRHTYSGGFFSLIAKSSNKTTSLVVENGKILLTSSPLISFGEFNSSVDGVSHSLLLRDLYIGLEKGATTKYLLAAKANPTLDIKYSITLESCTLDYTGASSGMTLVALGSKEGALTVEADGCRFVTENAIDSESIIPRMNMTLYNSFVYNVYIPVRSSISYITLDGVMYSELSELSLRLVDGEMHYVLSLPVAVNRAGLEVELCVAITLDSGVVAEGSWQISAVKHLGDLAGTGNNTATALAKDALAYIRSAYLYDKEGDEAEAQRIVSLIDEIIGEDWIASSQPDTTLPKADSTDGVYSVAMKLGAEAAFLLYLDDGYNVADFDIRVGDYSPRTEVCNDGERVYIKVDLYAYQMTETVEYSIKGTDISGEYNIRAYYDFAMDYGDQELVDLVVRLWSYSERARAYRDECLAGEGE